MDMIGPHPEPPPAVIDEAEGAPIPLAVLGEAQGNGGMRSLTLPQMKMMMCELLLEILNSRSRLTRNLGPTPSLL
uniref:Uncharacterized protein n=1 Tax=Meloidogyne incognita TaxID=6306 RepID=A0A914MMG9_MELIC